MSDSEYERMTTLAKEFESSLGNRLQWYLKLKAMWASNYVRATSKPYTQASHNPCQSSNATIKKVWNLKLNIRAGSEMKWKCRTELDLISIELFGS